MLSLLRPHALAIAWAVLASLAIAFAVASPRFAHVDFVAFYCAGDAVASGESPYREMPLNACERRVTSDGLYATAATVPAPLPPYALLPFALLSRIPFDAAYALFLSLSIAALAGTVVLLRRCTGIAGAVVVAALASTALDNVRKGQPLPLLCFALVASAWALSRGRDRLAALTAAITLVEPHIGLPACAALFAWRPRSRTVLVAAAAVLTVLSVVPFQKGLAVSYLTEVLPRHALSEAGWITQLSLSDPLILFGVSVPAALSIGFIQYALFAAAGVVLAKRSSASIGPELIVLVPPVFAVLGGTYVHQNAMLLAIPAALVIAVRLGSLWAYAALGLISISWLSISEPAQLVLSASAMTTVAYAARRKAALAAIAGFLTIIVGIFHSLLEGAVGKAPAGTPVVASALAEQSWAQLVAAINPPRDAQLVAFVMKLPTWGGLLIIITLTIVSRAALVGWSKRVNVVRAS